MSTTAPGRDEQRLAEMGYSQELTRAWSGFSNFAISFTIISILAGCFTTYGQAWNNGGPIAISIGWPLISCMILLVAFCMSELVSAYPTAGGIYWWASELGGAAWGWFTGWFNLVGLVAVVASVDYGCATFISALLNLWSVDLGVVNFADGASLGDIFIVFALVLALHALINIYSSHLVAMFNNISVWWHVAGVAVILGILIFAPDEHQSFSFVFGETINNSGFGQGMFWFYVLPLGFLLTQYTITGFDASAHISEETHGAEEAAPKGVWRSVFYSALIGWVAAARDHVRGDRRGRDQRRRRRLAGGPRQRAVEHGGGARGPDLLHRPAVLRHGVRDQRVAHDLRVLARPGDPRLADLDAAERQPHARRRRAVRRASAR